MDSLSTYVIHKKIGRGATSTIFTVTSNGELYAAKIIGFQKTPKDNYSLIPKENLFVQESLNYYIDYKLQ